MEQIYNIHVHLKKKGSDLPLSGENYKVIFYDQDVLEDDMLGSSPVDVKGHAEIAITKSRFRSKDSPMEKFPDIYFKVLDNESEVYKSPVVKDLQLKKMSDFDISEGTHFSLGMFLI